MIPDVPYRFAIRPLPADEGGGYLIEFPDLPALFGSAPPVTPPSTGTGVVTFLMG